MKFSLFAAAALALASFGTARAEPAGKITVYTSQPSDQMAAVVEAFKKDYPKVDVQLFRSGTTEVMNKLQAEFTAGAPQADVLLIADAVAMSGLKKAGQLLPYPEAKIEGIPAALVDPDKTFFGTKLITTGIVYNTRLVKTPPKSWNDLLAPENAAQTIMPSPLYSGGAVIHVGTLLQQPDFGWKYFETLARNGAVAGTGNGSVLDAVARGEKAYGMIVEYMAYNAKAKGSPVDFVFPQEGISDVTQPIAILKTTKNAEAAKAFVDWQLSRAAQEQSVGQGYFPILSDIKSPAGYPAVSDVKIMKADPSEMLKNDKAMKEKFTELFGG
ncbi:iron(III) transport system substrate-binding protein [Faunimonas pinastri]|uniref:Iron(III) transport system substrate-binding protein n=1 Tax=Faunimonas pinastri TaxID=1855383 RepID=A0A1H9AAZ5_9HYPH|nr:ABC transporter substrate-binding protein [Faunimonas pinastri]SEP73775.1 iron(III) transport system substrate-binding protein [Faunimonas pinastri]